MLRTQFIKDRGCLCRASEYNLFIFHFVSTWNEGRQSDSRETNFSFLSHAHYVSLQRIQTVFSIRLTFYLQRRDVIKWIYSVILLWCYWEKKNKKKAMQDFMSKRRIDSGDAEGWFSRGSLPQRINLVHSKPRTIHQEVFLRIYLAINLTESMVSLHVGFIRDSGRRKPNLPLSRSSKANVCLMPRS